PGEAWKDRVLTRRRSPQRCVRACGRSPRRLVTRPGRPVESAPMDFEDEKTNVLSVSPLKAAQKRQPAYVTVFRTRDLASVGRMYKLGDGETSIGRSVDAQVHLEDDGISRKHTKIVASADGTFQLVDLGSTNGTWLNERQIQTARLTHGALIQI